MRKLTRELCMSRWLQGELDYSLAPIQLGMGKSPWHVAICSILLQRTRRVQMRDILAKLFAQYPTPSELAKAGEELYDLLRPLGLYRTRARQLSRLSLFWVEGGWNELRELPGVGTYIADCVGLFCFDDRELESDDRVLRAYVESVPAHS